MQDSTAQSRQRTYNSSLPISHKCGPENNYQEPDTLIPCTRGELLSQQSSFSHSLNKALCVYASVTYFKHITTSSVQTSIRRCRRHRVRKGKGMKSMKVKRHRWKTWLWYRRIFNRSEINCFKCYYSGVQKSYM